jgi:type I restriction enzyme, S subunit
MIEAPITTPPLSSTWPTVRFGDVVRQVKVNVDPEESGLERYVAGEHMNTDDLHIRSWGTVGDGYLGPAFHRKFEAGQVLYGSRRTYLRKVAVADFDGVCANTTFVLEPSGDALLPELLPFIMQSEGFTAHAIQQSRGSVNPYVNWKDLAWYEFPLPPIDEQRRIAEILWAADEAVERWVQVLKDSEVLYTSLLDDLCIPKPRGNTGWTTCTIQNLMDANILAPLQDGNHGEVHPKASDYRTSGIPFIMASNIRNRAIDFNSCNFLPQDITDKLRIGFSYPGDILLTHKGTIGEIALVPPIEWKYIMLTPQVTYYRIIDATRMDEEYLYFYLQSRHFQDQLRRNSGQSTRAYASIGTQAKLTIQFPALDHQKMLVKKMSAAEKTLIEVQGQLENVQGVKRKLLKALL